MTQGCEYYGVAKEYIDKLWRINHEPRPKEEHLETLPYEDEFSKFKNLTIEDVDQLNASGTTV